MHIQPIFSIDKCGELHELIRAYPLATIFTATGEDANLLPLALLEDGANGRLSGHVAKDHSLLRTSPDGSGVTLVFQSPNAYISPRWYINGQRSGRLAPSWNYVAVQVRGNIRFVWDGPWMISHLARLTASQEAGRENAWSIDEMSSEFLQHASERLVGFEIDIVEMTGKRFLSQQRTEADRRNLIRTLALEESQSAKAVAALIQAWSGPSQ
ncbi:MAG: FMN-binding negative transcriptional regulator [Polaromonas sp.]|uniref:FMN-binding negative transcriptional regulator n=1 Tax=Polaromonas sp. TaxID=1869339 RepID=UPI002488391E|nr:FMN-binding negative transcriptional regulator [Polaromonas sp.]MDI1235972.1 FMN-binding negative transcriptional regulator [Polaromonas sp.]MDI1341079.1 FMN-binding negative transcriptional regulator [Polaromonas sp.]